MTESEHIKAFFTENRKDLIKLHRVEIMAGIPRNTLVYFLEDKRGLPQHHQDAIVRVISIVGYQPPTNDHQFL